VNVSSKEVWDDVAGAAFGDADQDDCINNAFEQGAVTVQLHTSESPEMFEAEFNDSVSTVMNFNKNLKFVLMTVHTKREVNNNDKSTGSSDKRNAFTLMMSAAGKTRPPDLKSAQSSQSLNGNL
jgi:hypothetical protein